MTNYKFLTTGVETNLKQKEFNPENQVVKSKVIKSTPKIKKIFENTSKIKELQSYILDCLSKNEDFLNQLTLPEQIDIQFKNTNVIEQLYKSLFKIETTANTLTNFYEDNNLINPIINMSTDIIKEFNTESPEQIFTHSLSQEEFLNNFRYFIAKTSNPLKIMTEIVFLHELSHIHLNEKFKDTLLIYPLLSKDNQRPALTQIINNIKEGFCDNVALYLTDLNYPSQNIIERFERVRKESPQGNVNDSIAAYDLDFKELKLNQKQTLDSLLEIAINNGLKLAQKQLKDEDFISEIRKDLCQILNIKEIDLKLKTEMDYINKIKEEIFKYNPMENNIDSVKVKIIEIREQNIKKTNNFEQNRKI